LRALDLLADPELDRAYPEPERGEPLQELRRQQRKLLRPRRRRDVDDEHAAAERTGLGSLGDAIAQQTTPSVPVDGDASVLRRDDASSVQ
jgi:hypothetical protein